MVAIFTKLILLISLLIVFTKSCVAENVVSNEVNAFQLSLNKFEIAKINLENTIKECDKKKIIVSKTVFRGISLTKDEWKIALYVLNFRADDACEKGKRGEFVVAASVYRETAKHYNLKAISAVSYSEDSLFGHYWMKLEAEAKYLNIPNKKRKTLENIQQLKKPFHLFETLSNLNDK